MKNKRQLVIITSLLAPFVAVQFFPAIAFRGDPDGVELGVGLSFGLAIVTVIMSAALGWITMSLSRDKESPTALIGYIIPPVLFLLFMLVMTLVILF